MVLAKVDKKYADFTNPFSQNLLMINHCQIYSPIARQDLATGGASWMRKRVVFSFPQAEHTLSMFKRFRYIWKFSPGVGWGILADRSSRACVMWPPYMISPRRLCKSSCGAHLGNRMHHWIKQGSCLKDKLKMFRINAVKRHKKIQLRPFRKLHDYTFALLGLVCSANNIKTRFL